MLLALKCSFVALSVCLGSETKRKRRGNILSSSSRDAHTHTPNAQTRYLLYMALKPRRGFKAFLLRPVKSMTFFFVFYTEICSHKHNLHSWHRYTHRQQKPIHGSVISEQVSGCLCESCYDLSFSPNASGRNTCHTMFRSIWRVHTHQLMRHTHTHTHFPSDTLTIVMWAWVTGLLWAGRSSVWQWNEAAGDQTLDWRICF